MLTISDVVFTVEIAKTLWINLRTVFGRELNKCISSVPHSGDSADEDDDDLYTGEWSLFYHLRFLTETMKGREMSGPLGEAVHDTPAPATLSAASSSSGKSNTLPSNERISGSGYSEDLDVAIITDAVISEDEEDYSAFRSNTKRTSPGIYVCCFQEK